MIFQHTWERVLSGDKTQTRRIVKWDESLVRPPLTVITPDRAKYQVGKTYAVQPARTKKGIARIQITGIRHEDARRS